MLLWGETKRRKSKGFLLLEVILSVLLVTGGLLVVTLSFFVSKKLLLESRELFRSGLLLREKMFEFEETGEIEEIPKNGAWADEAEAWSLQVAPIENTGLEHAGLEVSMPGKPGTGYALDTYLRKKKE